MFTGIIEETGTVTDIRDRNGGKRITIECSFTGELQIDQSISINGVCLTVIDCDNRSFSAIAVEETLRKTNLGGLSHEDKVNLERSVTANRLLDGHIVQGHIDTTGEITGIEEEGTDRILTIQYPESFRDLVVGRGSIAIDGISLTIADEFDHSFIVAIIPYTNEHTHLKYCAKGDVVNIEFDILGKYVVRYLQNRQ